MTNEIRFFWNGLKIGKGKLQRVNYSESASVNYPAGTITMYAKDYTGFSGEVKKQFTVHNDTDGLTDYFETDRIRVKPSHPLYGKVKAALDQAQERFARKAAA